MNLSKDDSNELHYVGFNQDFGCFAIGTTEGFKIFNVDPFRETFCRSFPNGGIGIVEMLFRCNLIAIVGGSQNPKYPPNKVMIWDDHQNKCIGELMFKSEVYAVKLRRDRVVVVLYSKVYVYRFSDLKLIDQISTIPNPRGLISLCPDVSNNVLTVPGLARGSIRIELYDISKATIIKAHDAEVAQFCLNADGSHIASASEKGTLIRLWDCHTGDLLREFRRGTDRAVIYCLAFNQSSTFLACSSDKGTIHIFSLLAHKNIQSCNNNTGVHNHEVVVSNPTTTAAPSSSSPAAVKSSPRDQHRPMNGSNESGTNNTTVSTTSSSSVAGIVNSPTTTVTTTSSSKNSSNNKSFGLNFLRGMVPQAIIPKYVNSEWSFAQVRGLEGQCICAFDKDSMQIIILSADGTYLLCSFQEGGECHRIATAKFLRPPNEDVNNNNLR